MPTDSNKESFAGMLREWDEVVRKILAGTGPAAPDKEDLSYADGMRHCRAEAQPFYDRLVGLRDQISRALENPMSSWETGRCIADNVAEDWRDQLTEILQGGAKK